MFVLVLLLGVGLALFSNCLRDVVEPPIEQIE